MKSRTSRNNSRKSNTRPAKTNKQNKKQAKVPAVYRDGTEIYLSPEAVEVNHNKIVTKQTKKHESREQLFGRLSRIAELETKLVRIKLGQSFLAIAQ